MYEYLPVLIVVATPLVLLLVFWIPLWRMRSHEGETAPDLNNTENYEINPRESVVFYFSTPACAPCRIVKPLVDELTNMGQKVVYVDISQSPDVARKFYIRVTPAVIVVENNKIKRTLVGPRLAQEVNALLADAASSKPG